MAPATQDTEAAQAGLTDEQVKQQKEELKAGKGAPSAKLEGVEESAQQQWSPHSRGGFPDNRVAAGVSDKGNARYGEFVTVTGGEHEGVFGVFVDIVSQDKEGYPELVLVRPQASNQTLLTVKYSDLAAAKSRGNGAR